MTCPSVISKRKCLVVINKILVSVYLKRLSGEYLEVIRISGYWDLGNCVMSDCVSIYINVMNNYIFSVFFGQNT